MQLWLDIEGSPVRRELPGGGSQLIAFMSFAVSRGFGATHPLIALADRLYSEHNVRMGPLTTFYEAEAEDSEDREKLEMTWQPPSWSSIRPGSDPVFGTGSDPVTGMGSDPGSRRNGFAQPINSLGILVRSVLIY